MLNFREKIFKGNINACIDNLNILSNWEVNFVRNMNVKLHTKKFDIDTISQHQFNKLQSIADSLK